MHSVECPLLFREELGTIDLEQQLTLRYATAFLEVDARNLARDLADQLDLFVGAHSAGRRESLGQQ